SGARIGQVQAATHLLRGVLHAAITVDGQLRVPYRPVDGQRHLVQVTLDSPLVERQYRLGQLADAEQAAQRAEQPLDGVRLPPGRVRRVGQGRHVQPQA